MSSGEEATLRPGDCLGGRYIIIEEIGRGGFGMVYRAVQQGINRHVAIKTLRKNAAVIPGFDFVEAFHREALHTSQLKHPNTITVFDYGESDGDLFLVMEFLEGETLYERLWRDKIMAPKTAVHITKQIAKSLAEAHNSGIIHGDLKPANIFLCNLYGERDFVKVLDFGIAKLIGEVDPAGMGTPEYMSPEQFSGQPLLAASDIYSLGLILYEMIAGRRPYDDEDTMKLARKQLLEPLPPMPAAVEQSPLGFLIRKATAKEPAHRYEDGWALYQGLDHLERPQDAAPTPRVSRAVRLGDELAQAVPPAAPAQKPEQRPTVPSDPAMRRAREERADEDAPIRPSESRLLRQEEAPLFGRDAEQAWLLDRVAEVSDARRPCLIVMGGGAGVGKTRLAHWLVHEATLGDAVLAGTGAQREGSPFALEGLRHALAYALGLTEFEVSARALRRVQERMQRLMGGALTVEQERAIQALYAPFEAEGSAVEIERVARLLLELASHHPLILHLDNIQSADAATLELLEALALRASQQPCALLVLCTVRREALPGAQEVARRLVSLVRSRQAVARTLEALEDEPARALAMHLIRKEAAVLGIRGDASAPLIDGLAQRSHGNPLYITELVRHLIDAEALTQGERTIELRPDVELDRLIPPRIGGLLRLRLAQLPHRHSSGLLLEHLLLRAALLGVVIPMDVLEAMLQQERDEGISHAQATLGQLRNLIALLAQEDLLVPVKRETPGGLEEALRFAQPLMHQILEERVLRLPEAKKLQRMAARAKRRYLQQGGLLDDAQAQIAQHYQRADADQEVVDFFMEAAESALRKGTTAEALRWLEHARDATDSSPAGQRKRLAVLIDMAHLHSLFGGYVDFEATLVIAMRLAENLNHTVAQAELHYLAGILAYSRGHVDRAEERFDQAISTVQELSTPAAATLTAAQQHLDLRLLHLQMESLPPRLVRALARLGLAWVRAVRSHLGAAQELVEDAVQDMEEARFSWGLAFAHQRLGELFALGGALAASRRQLERAKQLFLQITPCLDLCAVQLVLCDLELLEGNPEAALRAAETLRASLPAPPAAPCRARMHRLQARTALLRGERDAALQHYAESVALTLPGGIWESQVILLTELAGVLAAAGNQEVALQHARKAVDLLNGDPRSVLIPPLQLLLGRLAELDQPSDDALRWYHAALQTAEGLGHPLHRLRALASQAAALAASELDQARAQLDQAEAIALELRVVLPELNAAREAVGRALLRAGAAQAATPHLRSAAEAWGRLGNAAAAQRITRLLP